MRGRAGLRSGGAAVTLALAVALGVAPVLVPTASADPSASQVRDAKAEAARRAKEVAAAAAAIDGTQAQLDKLNTAAEVAIEAYDGARVRLDRAAKAEHAARLVLAAAAERVDKAHAKLQDFAAASYMSGGNLGAIESLMTADGPATLLYRASTLNVISRSQHDALDELAAAQSYQRVVERQTSRVLADRANAAAAAERAQRTAKAEVQRQAAALAELQNREHELQNLLRKAQAKASRLERERLAAIARARAEAAARRLAAQRAAQLAAQEAAKKAAEQAAQGSGSGGYVPPPPSGGGVVSAETENAAVAVAMRQIGKPYVWGAEGPDSFDCSGLVMYSYGQVGVHLDHWTGYQWNEGAHIAAGDARPGDLFFFATDTSNPDTIHHVGMYIGNGQMVEAPYTGANVRVSNAFRSDLIGVVRPFAG